MLITAGLAATMGGCTAPPHPLAPFTDARSSSPPPSIVDQARAALQRYLDASNSVDYLDEHTYSAVFATVTGAQLEYEKSFLADMHERGMTGTGATTVIFAEVSAEAPQSSISVTFDLCLDLSARRYVDVDGVEWTQDSATKLSSLATTAVRGSGGTWLIGATTARKGEPLCE